MLTHDPLKKDDDTAKSTTTNVDKKVISETNALISKVFYFEVMGELLEFSEAISDRDEVAIRRLIGGDEELTKNILKMQDGDNLCVMVKDGTFSSLIDSRGLVEITEVRSQAGLFLGEATPYVKPIILSRKTDGSSKADSEATTPAKKRSILDIMD